MDLSYHERPASRIRVRHFLEDIRSRLNEGAHVGGEVGEAFLGLCTARQRAKEGRWFRRARQSILTDQSGCGVLVPNGESYAAIQRGQPGGVPRDARTSVRAK